MIRGLAIVVVITQFCGCHYARRWTADREPPEHARIVSAGEAHRSRDAPSGHELDAGDIAVGGSSTSENPPFESDSTPRPTERIAVRDRASDPAGMANAWERDDAAPVVRVKSETRESGSARGRRNDRPPVSARSRWDSLLESFGRPRRIPLPRTDTDETSEPEADRPDFDGV